MSSRIWNCVMETFSQTYTRVHASAFNVAHTYILLLIILLFLVAFICCVWCVVVVGCIRRTFFLSRQCFQRFFNISFTCDLTIKIYFRHTYAQAHTRFFFSRTFVPEAMKKKFFVFEKKTQKIFHLALAKWRESGIWQEFNAATYFAWSHCIVRACRCVSVFLFNSRSMIMQDAQTLSLLRICTHISIKKKNNIARASLLIAIFHWVALLFSRGGEKIC